MSAPNVSDGAVKAAEELHYEYSTKWWDGLSTEIRTGYNFRELYDDACRERERIAAIITKHCPVGCAANEVGAGVASPLQDAWAQVSELSEVVDRQRKQLSDLNSHLQQSHSIHLRVLEERDAANARISELEAEVARFKESHGVIAEAYRITVFDKENLRAQLVEMGRMYADEKAQLAAAESRCIGLRGLLTNEQEALKRCCKDLAATPAPTAPVDSQ